MDILFAAMNTYRLAGAMALLVRLSAARGGRYIDSSRWRLTFSWIAIVLLAAILLQKFAGVNTNVFYSFPGGDLPNTPNTQMIVLGLFRASVGILGLFAMCAFLASEAEWVGRWFFSLAGAFSGFAVIVLTGSKTSLVAALVLIASRIPIWRRFWSVANAAFIILLLVSVLLLTGPGITKEYVNAGLAKFSSSFGSERESFAWRVDLWQACMDDVGANPIVALGFPLQGTIKISGTGAEEVEMSPYSPATYHNEYLSVFMLGGLLTLLAYLTGLMLIGYSLLRSDSVSAKRTFALLVLAGGLMEATAVAHLQPSLLFACPVFLCAAIYGLGARPSAPPNMDCQLAVLRRR